MKKVIEIELIDDIAQEIREKLCTLDDDKYDVEDRNNWEYKVGYIILNNLKQYVIGDYDK